MSCQLLLVVLFAAAGSLTVETQAKPQYLVRKLDSDYVLRTCISTAQLSLKDNKIKNKNGYQNPKLHNFPEIKTKLIGQNRQKFPRNDDVISNKIYESFARRNKDEARLVQPPSSYRKNSAILIARNVTTNKFAAPNTVVFKLIS